MAIPGTELRNGELVELACLAGAGMSSANDFSICARVSFLPRPGELVVFYDLTFRVVGVRHKLVTDRRGAVLPDQGLPRLTRRTSRLFVISHSPPAIKKRARDIRSGTPVGVRK
jgi:hypothetical protein